MKKALLLLICFMSAVILFGQQQKVYSLPGVEVSPPELMIKIQGNSDSYLNDYLKSNFLCPESAAQWNDEGVEVVKFVVSTTGKVEDLKVLCSVSPAIDAEILRVLESTSGLWRPCIENGKPVAREKEVSVFIAGDGINPTQRFLQLAKQQFALGNKKFFMKKDNKSALYFFDKALCYMPYDKCILSTRGMCKYQLGDKQGACKDWNRVKDLGGVDADSFLNNLCEMEGYKEMISMVVVR
jgi:hypothetical protein